MRTILQSLVDDELIPNEIEDLSNGKWQSLMLSPEDMQIERDNFIQLAESFRDKLNEVVLPVRLGIYALYSTKKVSIFNTYVLKILDYYLSKEDFKYKNHGKRLPAGQVARNQDQNEIEFAKYVLDEMTKEPKLFHDKPD